MIVRCVNNDTKAIPATFVSKRLQESIHLEGSDDSLEIGSSYEVQAIEERADGGVWFYLHLDENDPYPYPQPAEFFSVEDTALPPGWCMKLGVECGSVRIKRVSFCDWADNDSFYEELVDGDPQIVAAYSRSKR